MFLYNKFSEQICTYTYIIHSTHAQLEKYLNSRTESMNQCFSKVHKYLVGSKPQPNIA